MEHVPELVSTWIVSVPDEESARAVAAFMVERGYAMVRVRPDRAGNPRGPWNAVGLDEGPYPDADVGWWRSVEGRLVGIMAGERGGTGGCLLAHAELARRSALDGEVVGDRTPEDVRRARLAALAGEPARAPAPEIVHRLGERETTGELGTPVVLAGLEDVDWASLVDGYGSGEGVPELLLRMAANDEGWDEAVFIYSTDVIHQGTCYPWTAPTVAFLVQLVCAPQLVSDYRMGLLFNLFYMALEDPGPACGEEIDDLSSCEALTCRAVLDHLPDVLARWPDAGLAERAWLVVLAALSPEAAADRLPEFRAFRDGVDGPSPALDLALALAAGDDDAAAGLALDASTWDEVVGERLSRGEPLRARHLRALFHLAGREFAPG